MSSLETAVNILNCFGVESSELAVSEVANHLKIPKSTVSRLMKAMADFGLIDRHEETKRYRVGLLPFRLGNLYQAHTKALDLADDAVAELVEQTGFTGYVGALNGLDIVILRMQPGRYPVRIVLEPGYRVPAFTTAFGKHLMSRFSNEALRQRLPATVTYEPTKLKKSLGRLFAELDVVRRRKWAGAEGETYPGIGAIGTSVGSGDGQPAIGFALSFPLGAVSKKQRDDMVSKILAAARRIAAKTGDPLWAAP